MIKTGTIIFSVFKNTTSEATNHSIHSKVAAFLMAADIDFTEVNGVYKGHSELSFVVSHSERRLVEILVEKFSQESFLLIRGNGYTYLEYADGSSDRLGKWSEVSEAQAKEQDAYTEVDGTYYVAA